MASKSKSELIQKNAIVDWWLLSERKYTTFQQLYESNNLNYD